MTRVRTQSRGVSDLDKDSLPPQGCLLFVPNPWAQPLSLTHLLEAALSRRGCGWSWCPEATSCRVLSCSGGSCAGEAAFLEWGLLDHTVKYTTLAPPLQGPAHSLATPTRCPALVSRDELGSLFSSTGFVAVVGGEQAGEGSLEKRLWSWARLSLRLPLPAPLGREDDEDGELGQNCPWNPTSEATTGQRSSGRRGARPRAGLLSLL